MAIPKGTIDLTILADGTIRAETGDMGGVAHKAADDFLAFVQQMMGGQVQEQKAKQGQHHHHHHDEEHHRQ